MYITFKWGLVAEEGKFYLKSLVYFLLYFGTQL